MVRLFAFLILLIAGIYTRINLKEESKGYKLIDNNKEWLDDTGEKIQAQGGGIFKNGDTFHWFGMQYPIWTALNHYTSKDLRTWHKEEPVLLPGSKLVPFGAKDWVGRPCVVFNPNTKLFILKLEWGGKKPFRNRFAFLTAKSLDGPWLFHTENTINQLPDSSGHLYNLGDLTLCADGKNAYLLYSFDKPVVNYSQAIIKLDKDFMTPLAPNPANYQEFTGKKYPEGVQEAAYLFKRNGYYYYFTSLCKGWFGSPTRYRTSKVVTGKGSNWTENNIVSTSPLTDNSFNTQHDFVMPIYGSKDTTFIYCGDRWNNFKPQIGGVGFYQWYPLTFDHAPIPVPTINGPGYAQNGGDWLLNIKTGKWKPVADLNAK